MSSSLQKPEGGAEKGGVGVPILSRGQQGPEGSGVERKVEAVA